MYQAIIITPRNNTFIDFARGLMQNGDVAVTWATSGRQALEMIAAGRMDLVVTDETVGDMTGLELIRKLVCANPLINTVAVSRLSAEAFHEASEGLGVLAQLPENPVLHHGEDIIGKLRQVCFRVNTSGLSGQMGGG